MNIRKLSGVALAVAFVATPVAIKFTRSAPQHEADLVKVERKEIHPLILASGNFVYKQEVQLSSELIGRVSELLVREGQAVTKGQVLLRLDPSSYRAELAQQEANLRSAEVAIERARINVENEQANVERYRKLMQAKFIDASKFSSVQHQLDLAQVELRASSEARQLALAQRAQVRERLAKTEVRTPISGIATQIQIKEGETAVPSTTGIAGSNMLTVADTASLMAEVNVDEADIAGVRMGQLARVYPAAVSDVPVQATVDQISLAPKVGQQGRSYTVKLRLAEGAQRDALRTGMTCRVEISTGNGGTLNVLPVQSILSAEGGSKVKGKSVSHVFRVTDGMVKKQVVEVGLADDANQQIVKGLAAGDTVVVGPARLLRELHDGDLVKPIKADTAKPEPVRIAARSAI